MIKKTGFILLTLLLLGLLSGCGNFYSSTGGTGSTGSTGTLPGNGILTSGYPTEGETISNGDTLKYVFDNDLNESSVSTNILIYDASGTVLTGYTVSVIAGSPNTIEITGSFPSDGAFKLVILSTLQYSDGSPINTDLGIDFNISASGGDTTAPGAITPLYIISSNGGVILEWEDPTDTDLDYIIVSNMSDYTIQTVAAGTGYLHIRGIANDSYANMAVFAVDTSGNESTIAYMNGMAQTAGTAYTMSIDGTLPSLGFRFMHPVEGFPVGSSDSTTGVASLPYLISEKEVSYQLWYTVLQWALSNGYYISVAGRQGPGDIGGTYDATYPDIPVVQLDWISSVVWCNALTAYYNSCNSANQLSFVYLNGGAPITSTSDVSTFSDIEYDQKASGFRLPEYGEWQAAARYIGTTTAYAWAVSSGGFSWTPGSYPSGASSNYTDTTETELYCWIGNTTITNSGQKSPNQMGLYDMSGNVAEMCYNTSTSFPVFGGNPENNTAVQMQILTESGTAFSGSTTAWQGFRLARTEYYWRSN